MISASDQLKLQQSKSVMNQMTEAVYFFKTCHFCHEVGQLDQNYLLSALSLS